MERTDLELLRAYAVGGDAAAVAAIAERHPKRRLSLDVRGQRYTSKLRKRFRWPTELLIE